MPEPPQPTMDILSSVDPTASGGTLADPYRPSFFELVAQEQLSHLLKPAVRYVLTVLAQRNPRYLLRIVNRFDEIYALLMLAVDQHYLRTWSTCAPLLTQTRASRKTFTASCAAAGPPCRRSARRPPCRRARCRRRSACARARCARRSCTSWCCRTSARSSRSTTSTSAAAPAPTTSCSTTHRRCAATRPTCVRAPRTRSAKDTRTRRSRTSCGCSRTTSATCSTARRTGAHGCGGCASTCAACAATRCRTPPRHAPCRRRGARRCFLPRCSRGAARGSCSSCSSTRCRRASSSSSSSSGGTRRATRGAGAATTAQARATRPCSRPHRCARATRGS